MTMLAPPPANAIPEDEIRMPHRAFHVKNAAEALDILERYEGRNIIVDLIFDKNLEKGIAPGLIGNLIEKSLGDITIPNTEIPLDIAKQVAGAGAGRAIRFPNVKKLDPDVARILATGTVEIQLPAIGSVSDIVKEQVSISIEWAMETRDMEREKRDDFWKVRTFINKLDSVFNLPNHIRKELVNHGIERIILSGNGTIDAQKLKAYAQGILENKYVPKEKKKDASESKQEREQAIAQQVEDMITEFKRRKENLMRLIGSKGVETVVGTHEPQEDETQALVRTLKSEMPLAKKAQKAVLMQYLPQVRDWAALSAEKKALEKGGKTDKVRGMERRLRNMERSLQAFNQDVVKIAMTIAKLEIQIKDLQQKQKQLEEAIQRYDTASAELLIKDLDTYRAKYLTPVVHALSSIKKKISDRKLRIESLLEEATRKEWESMQKKAA